MGINSLEETENNPEVDSDDVQAASEEAVDQGAEDGSSTQDEHLSRMRVLGSQTERSGVLVVNLVDVLVENTGVESLVGYGIPNLSGHFQTQEGYRVRTNKVEEILEEEEQENLGGHGLQRRERNLISRHSEGLSGRMEKPDLRERWISRHLGFYQVQRHTKGSSIVKCEKRTVLVHSHCSAAVGIFLGCNFHCRK